MGNYNIQHLPKITTLQLQNVASKGCAFAASYGVNNFGDDYYRRLERVIESILYATIDKAEDASGILDRIINKEEELEKIKQTKGFDSQSAFGLYVPITKAKIASGTATETHKNDTAVAILSLACAIKIQNLEKHGYYVAALYQRLLGYLSLRYGVELRIKQSLLMGEVFLANVNAMLEEIKSTPNEALMEEPMTSFAFEDLNPIFMGEDDHDDAHLMKDCELQSYELNTEIV